MSMALLAAGLAALSACGGGEAESNAANNVVVEDLNLSDDLGDPNLLGEEGLGNEADLNAVDLNAADANAAGNAAENSQ